MKTLAIKKYPQKILKQKAAIVSRITPGVQKLIPQMIETMYKNDGIGLAAPQIGVSKRIIIVESSTHPHDKSEETHNDDPLQEDPSKRVEALESRANPAPEQARYWANLSLFLIRLLQKNPAK